MPVVPSTQPSTSVRLVALGVVATLVLFIAGALFAGTANAEPRQVWVCKYVGQPGNETLKPGANPIKVSSSATVGSFFQDGQELSYVAGEVYDEAPPPSCPETPPVTETTPPVTETTTPPVTETTTPPVTETTTPPVTETTTPPVTETTTPPVTETTPPVAAPTDLGSSTTTGIVSLFAIALSLVGAAAYVLRGARH